MCYALKLTHSPDVKDSILYFECSTLPAYSSMTMFRVCFAPISCASRLKVSGLLVVHLLFTSILFPFEVRIFYSSKMLISLSYVHLSLLLQLENFTTLIDFTPPMSCLPDSKSEIIWSCTTMATSQQPVCVQPENFAPLFTPQISTKLINIEHTTQPSKPTTTLLLLLSLRLPGH